MHGAYYQVGAQEIFAGWTHGCAECEVGEGLSGLLWRCGDWGPAHCRSSRFLGTVRLMQTGAFDRRNGKGYFRYSYQDTTGLLSLVYLITSAFQCLPCLVNPVNYRLQPLGNTNLPLLSGNKGGGWLRSVLEVTAAHSGPERRNARCEDGRFLSPE